MSGSRRRLPTLASRTATAFLLQFGSCSATADWTGAEGWLARPVTTWIRGCFEAASLDPRGRPDRGLARKAQGSDQLWCWRTPSVYPSRGYPVRPNCTAPPTPSKSRQIKCKSSMQLLSSMQRQMPPERNCYSVLSNAMDSRRQQLSLGTVGCAVCQLVGDVVHSLTFTLRRAESFWTFLAVRSVDVIVLRSPGLDPCRRPIRIPIDYRLHVPYMTIQRW